MGKHSEHKIVIVNILHGIHLENTLGHKLSKPTTGPLEAFMTPSYISLHFHLWTFPLETVYDLHTSLYHSDLNPSSLPLLPHSEFTDWGPLVDIPSFSTFPYQTPLPQLCSAVLVKTTCRFPKYQ